MLTKKLIVIPFLLLFIMGGCAQPQRAFDTYYKQKMEAVIWDGVPYHIDNYAQEASRSQNKSLALHSTILKINPKKVRNLTKYLDSTIDTLSKSIPRSKVYFGFDAQPFTLLSHKVDNIIVTYIDNKLAHVYVSFKKESIPPKLSDKAIKQAVIKQFGVYNENIKEVYMNTSMKQEPLGDIKDVLNKKFGKAFYYGAAEVNNDSNEIWTWGMHHNFYYKVVVNQDRKYEYLSIKSKAFMKMLAEEIIDVRKWQRKQDGIVESMVTVHKKDKK